MYDGKDTQPRYRGTRVSIEPTEGIFTIFQHLDYTLGSAFAEFVDNSYQSFKDNIDNIRAVSGKSTSLRVEIVIDTRARTITITDNAAGISPTEFPRAFRPAAAPLSPGQLHERGMGLKAAACFCSNRWQVVTSPLGVATEYSIDFDVAQVVQKKLKDLPVRTRDEHANLHFTQVRLTDCRQIPSAKKLTQIKRHLASMYRDAIRTGLMELSVNGEVLAFEPPKILSAPRFNAAHEAQGEAKTWRKPIDFVLENGYRVRGFAALRAKGSTKDAGFALSRFGRVIQGTADTPFRPAEVFGRSNSFAFQRLFGELCLDDFAATANKTSIQFEDFEEEFLEKLKAAIQGGDMDLLAQARNYREVATRAVAGRAANRAMNNTSDDLSSRGAAAVDKAAESNQEPVTHTRVLPDAQVIASRTIVLEHQEEMWTVDIEFSTDPEVQEVLSFANRQFESNTHLGIRIGLASRFVRNRVRTDNTEHLDAVLRIMAALAIAEYLAVRSGIKKAARVRNNMNQLLEMALS